DDAFFARMKAEFTDAEILELTAMIGEWLAFGRLNAVLDIAEACAWAPSAPVASASVRWRASTSRPGTAVRSTGCGHCPPSSVRPWARSRARSGARGWRSRGASA